MSGSPRQAQDAAFDELRTPLSTVSNLSELVVQNAGRRGDVECLVQVEPERRALSWAELNTRIDAVAAGFADTSTGGLGLVAGHRVGLQGANSIEFVVGYLAILRAGLVAVPIDPELPSDEATRLSDDVGIRLRLGGSDHPLSAAGLDDLARHGHSAVVSPPDPEALAVLLPTAGTSNEPQVAMLSHRALLASVTSAQLGGVSADTTVLGAVPYVQVFGLAAVLGSWLSAGARLVVTEESSSRLGTTIADERVDHLPMTPALLFRLLRGAQGDQLRSVRQVLSAGASLPAWLSREFTDRTGLRVEQGYGLTEATGGVAATFGGPVLGPTHVGRPLPGVEVRIVNAPDAEEPGLIALRGANLFGGYWPDGRGGPDADGWFLTDDLGYFRGSELFLVDRAREVVVVHGFPVYPAEIEQVIRELSRVTGVAVVGTPDPRRGDRVVAFVSGQELSGALVAEHCRTRLAPYKRPAEIRLINHLPRGVTGEVRRAALRRMLADEHSVPAGGNR